MNLVEAFGLDSERGVSLVEFLVSTCATSINVWAAESDVMDAVVNLLLCLAESGVRSHSSHLLLLVLQLLCYDEYNHVLKMVLNHLGAVTGLVGTKPSGDEQ